MRREKKVKRKRTENEEAKESKLRGIRRNVKRKDRETEEEGEGK